MKIVITGQKSFGRAVLKRLVNDGHDILGVAVAPQESKKDKMVGTAMRYQIPIIAEAEKLISNDIPEETDLIVAAHSHWIVSNKIIAKAKYGAIGFHPSLLPLHRGRDAVKWTIKMNDKVTGGTIFYLNDVADGGPVIDRKLLFVDKNWDYHDLWNKLFDIGVEMIANTVNKIDKKRGILPCEEQDEKLATWEPSFDRPRLVRNELIQLE
ncbi:MULTISPECIES: formyltransferase family protein [unclassified Enterococcus]|uniref:formyltransferase family protein n=1 Tax=unclassified Enterococcus TaxID=2608891 RepID=UPI0028FDA76F|nr:MULTISPECIES: formyltransferase family protein [unclassified Enterococcus]MDU0319169.1 formyltransferase family protein [Enterococcus sp. 2STP]MDU0335228.1 formyltransferase family protein [Enterococcus sp. 2CBP]MDU0350635.1 formyltransferase family protein [Enterococcus sp. 3MOLP]